MRTLGGIFLVAALLAAPEPVWAMLRGAAGGMAGPILDRLLEVYVGLVAHGFLAWIQAVQALLR